jgi:fumarate hydratase, class II
MRIEKDSMGEMEVPDDALWGASTHRAVLNFPISGQRFSPRFISALGVIKYAAARANMQLGLLDAERGEAICRAAEEVIDGTLTPHFVLDIYQTGSGTSTNMNANEVIANRAMQFLAAEGKGDIRIHPNDHVNMCQSSNDVIPTAIHVAAYLAVQEALFSGLNRLSTALLMKAEEFKDVIKAGRTHLQDATPLTLGQEFGGYATQVVHSAVRLRSTESFLCELALGGTAVGTGLNTHPDFAKTAIEEINGRLQTKFREAVNHFEAQGARDAAVELSGQLKTVAVSLMKIANDIRWLASGPRCGLGEIDLPAIQPGSSIMPAKVNPVLCESVMMVCAQVMGNDTTITIAGQHGNFELNVMMPVIAHNLLESIEILGNAANNLAERCIEGITANREKCLEYAEKSLAVCTALAPIIGYDNAAKLAKRAYEEDKTVRETAREMNLLPEEELDRVLDLFAMTKPGL